MVSLYFVNIFTKLTTSLNSDVVQLPHQFSGLKRCSIQHFRSKLSGEGLIMKIIILKKYILIVLLILTVAHVTQNKSAFAAPPEFQRPLGSKSLEPFNETKIAKLESSGDWGEGCESASSAGYYLLAMKYCKKASASEDIMVSSRGNRIIGDLYRGGYGVHKNVKEAYKWYLKAAEFGDYDAQRSLVEYYYKGYAGKVDKVNSLAWSIVSEKFKRVSNEFVELMGSDFVSFLDSIFPSTAKIRTELTDNEVTIAEKLSEKYLQAINKNIELNFTRKTKYNKLPATKDKLQQITSLPKVIKPYFNKNDIAIIIGIEKYRSAPPTQFAINDAKLVREYFRVMGIPDRNVEFLTDERATYSDIRKVLETKLPNIVKADSRVIVYYAGHGAPNPTDGTAYLVPYDGDPAYLSDTSYPVERMYEKLSMLPAKEVLVVMDACFSGTGGRSVLPPGARSLVARPKTPTHNRLIILSSTQENQITTTLSEQQHGLFTYFFLRALQEKKKDVADIYQYLKPLVEDEAKRQNVDQSPTITPDVETLKGRFVFFN